MDDGGDLLLRKMKRAALRKQKVVAVEDSDKGSEASRDRKRRKRSRSRRRRFKGGHSSDEEMKEQARMMAALRPQGLVHQGIGRGSLDVVTGGVGFSGPVVSSTQDQGGFLSMAAKAAPMQKVCIKFLLGNCQDGDMCMNNHPLNPLDANRWIQYFSQQPCKYGDACPADRCIYAHPNKRFNVGPLVGTSL